MDVSITVIVPVYNVEKYLVECLNSIVRQTVLFDEVILINDGSADMSLSICQEYILKYGYFRLINQKNQGLSVARNKGLEYATKEYIMFLDSDDYLRADTVRILKDELSRFPMDAVYFDADIQCEDGYRDRKNFYDRKSACLDGYLMSGWEFFLKCYPDNYVVSACMAVYKKRTIVDARIRFPEGLYYEDNYFSFAFITEAKFVAHISEKLYQRRYRDNSITTSSYSEKKLTDYIKIILLIWNEISHINNINSLVKKNMLLRFIDDYCGLAINSYRLCLEQDIPLGSNVTALFYRMEENYISLLNQYPLIDEVENLFLLNRILRNLRQIAQYCLESRIGIEQMIEKLKIKRDSLYQILLGILPLNSEKHKVGIYGTGKHTEGFLDTYERIIGKIKCDLTFIDSRRENGIYRGKEIVNYQEVNESFDMIIISSFQYRVEMIQNIKAVCKEVLIFDFYKTVKEDLFSDLV